MLEPAQPSLYADRERISCHRPIHDGADGEMGVGTRGIEVAVTPDAQSTTEHGPSPESDRCHHTHNSSDPHLVALHPLPDPLSRHRWPSSSRQVLLLICEASRQLFRPPPRTNLHYLQHEEVKAIRTIVSINSGRAAQSHSGVSTGGNMATTTDFASPPPATFSRSSSLSITRSPDTASPIYPERAIRPLPKSRLKSKLSPEQASSIVYPPDPPPISPTLNFSGPDGAYGVAGGNRAVNGDAAYSQYLHHRATLYQEPEHNHCTCGRDGDSGDDEVEFDHPDYRYDVTSPCVSNGVSGSGRLGDGLQRRQTAPIKSGPPGSTASSADGYESFENTSNKKKRKIPLAIASGVHQNQLSAEMANMGISGGPGDAVGDDTQSVGVNGVAAHSHVSSRGMYAGVNGATVLSGAGRGRYGRQNGRGDHGIRRPLASSGVNTHGYNSRLPIKSAAEAKNGIVTGSENAHTGIISQAIKSAAEQGPLSSQRGQENSSSLLSSAATPATPANSKTQFTFAMESESASKLVDQQAATYATHSPSVRGANGNAGQGRTGTMPVQGAQHGAVQRGVSQSSQSNVAGPGRPPGQTPHSGHQPGTPAPAPKPKLRRQPSKEYALAARQRRLHQEYTNFQHRPTKDNMWICEFCEYEDIFGTPPTALIRQYEIKDRAERKRAAEKRRLLEKARAKGRKTKKGGKNNKVGAPQGNVAGVPAAHHANHDQNLRLEGEDYYDDEYDGDEYEPIGPDGEYAEDYSNLPPPSNTADTAGSGSTRGGGGTARPGG